MDHRGNVVFHHLLVDRIPVAIRQWWILPMPAGRIGVQIDADEPVFVHGSIDLGEAVLRRDAGTLRQHRDPDEIFRE